MIICCRTHLGAAFSGIAYGFLTLPSLQLDDASTKAGQEEGITLLARRYADPCKSFLFFSLFILVLTSLLLIIEPPLDTLATYSYWKNKLMYFATGLKLMSAQVWIWVNVGLFLWECTRTNIGKSKMFGCLKESQVWFPPLISKFDLMIENLLYPPTCPHCMELRICVALAPERSRSLPDRNINFPMSNTHIWSLAPVAISVRWTGCLTTRLCDFVPYKYKLLTIFN